MLGELEEKARQHSRGIAARDDRIRWHQEKLTQLDSELSQAREEGDKRQSKINDLKGRIEQAKADKLRAFSEIKELTETLARQKEEMGKMRSESQQQVESLQGELTLNRHRSSELEGRITETESQITLLRSQNAEAERQLALLRGEQDATCAEAFQLGAEEVRAKISREHPEWDLSFLETDSFEACTPGAEEAEYADSSDVDFDTVLGPSEVVAPEGRSPLATEGVSAFEAGESSRTPPSATDKTTEAAPDPGS